MKRRSSSTRRAPCDSRRRNGRTEREAQPRTTGHAALCGIGENVEFSRRASSRSRNYTHNTTRRGFDDRSILYLTSDAVSSVEIRRIVDRCANHEQPLTSRCHDRKRPCSQVTCAFRTASLAPSVADAGAAIRGTLRCKFMGRCSGKHTFCLKIRKLIGP